MHRAVVFVALLAGLLFASGTAGAQSAPACRFVLGFATLHDMIPSEVGQCLDNESFNPANGDTLQHATGGLLVWRKSDNWTAFTDGYHTWVNGPYGLQERLNTQRFSWEANPDGLPVIGGPTPPPLPTPPAPMPPPTPTAPPPPPTPTTTPTHAGPAAMYPNPTLTPGETFPGVTAGQLCAPGYASTVPAVSPAERALVFAQYGLSDTPGTYELDHFIPIGLGGDNAVANLWPEPYNPSPAALQKDKVETVLHAQVCAGTIPLQQAQDEIKTDWYSVFLLLQS